jgi:hypothetical protein
MATVLIMIVANALDPIMALLTLTFILILPRPWVIPVAALLSLTIREIVMLSLGNVQPALFIVITAVAALLQAVLLYLIVRGIRRWLRGQMGTLTKG